MEISQDPRLKITVKNTVLAAIYTPYHTRRRKLFEGIMLRNMTLVQTPYECFRFRGKVYGKEYAGNFVRPKLHPDLTIEMDELTREHDKVMKTEQPLVGGFITAMLNASDSLHDWVRILPPALHSALTLVNPTGTSPPMKLSDQEVVTFLAKHNDSLQKLKQRLATNLIHV